MSNLIYTTTLEGVEPVFFPVVPDAFMLRPTTPARRFRPSLADYDWQDISVIDVRPFAPSDRWSF